MTRQQIADRLTAALPAEWVVSALAREFDMDAGVPVYVAVMRSKVQPAPNYLGAFLETYTVYIITTSMQDAVELEDALDAALDTCLETLDTDNTMSIESAERDTYGARELHCWRVELLAGSARV